MAGDYARLALAVGYNATTSAPVMMTSPDGVTWTEVTGYGGGSDSCVVAGDTYFASNGTTGANNLAVSGDGASWPLQSVGFAHSRMAWTGTKWVVVDENTSYTSTDATSWSSGGATGSLHSSRRVVHAGGVTVSTGLGGGGTTTVVYSTNEGTSWSTYTPPANTNEGQDLAYGAGRWVIARRRTSGGDPADIGIITSTNGTSWSVVNTGIALNNGWLNVNYGNGVFLLVGVTNTGAPAVATSATGAANSFSVFTPTGLPSFPTQAGRLTSWKGRWLYVDPSTGGTNIYSSTDGVTWTATSFTNRVWTDISAGVARPLGGIYTDGSIHLS